MANGMARAAAGGAAGLVATAVMTALMAAAERVGLLPGPPPELIVARFLPKLGPDATRRIAVVLHLGYGVAAGAAFSFAVPHARRRRRTGLSYGLAMWVVGYEGWVPLLGVLPPAHRDRPGRVGTMIAAHAVYGTALARLLRR